MFRAAGTIVAILPARWQLGGGRVGPGRSIAIVPE